MATHPITSTHTGTRTDRGRVASCRKRWADVYLRIALRRKCPTTGPIARGDVVAVEWVYSGTNSGPLATPDGVLPPTGRAVTLRGASFLRFNSAGLIVEEHRYYDRSSFFQQLGLQ